VIYLKYNESNKWGGNMGNNLRKLRTDKKLSQRELSSLVHINQVSISKMENGLHSISDDQLFTLADFFDVSIDYLLGRNWNPPNRTIYQPKEFGIKDILHKFKHFSVKELMQLRGAIDYRIETEYNTQTDSYPFDESETEKNKLK
jgi:transcriptional regulator with XRE-family HTH domain